MRRLPFLLSQFKGLLLLLHFLCIFIYEYTLFPRQSLKRFTFRVKSSDSTFFLLGLSPIVNKFDKKMNLFKPFSGKFCLIHLEIVKRPKKFKL